ncbi:MAG: OmpH family outer membrane protein [Candidatus Omnitrophica bacterium]|nr:OmpH family outer membrane protein [Candidatus Omnitrophota bacterium]
MKKLLKAIILTAFTFSLMNLPIFAEDLKIGFVDVLKVFNDYKKTADYDDKLEEEKEKVDSKLEEKKDNIEKMQKKLSLLKDAEKEKQDKEINEAVREYRELERKAYIDIKKERDEKMKEIFDDVTKIIEDYAKDKKYDLIIDKTAVHYGNQVMDLTSEILKIANNTYKKQK